MENNENLNKFVDSVVSNSEEPDTSYKEHLQAQARSIIAEFRKSTLREDAFNNMSNSPIKLHGDDVIINGKLIGHLKNDLNDHESGVSFISADGKFSKEFDDIQSLYAYLAQTFGVKEAIEQLGLEKTKLTAVNIVAEESPKIENLKNMLAKKSKKDDKAKKDLDKKD